MTAIKTSMAFRAAAAAAATLLAGVAFAQDSGINSTTPLRLPEAPKVFGSTMPAVVKAAVIVNGEVITQTDIDQRIALTAIASGEPLQPEQIEALRTQVTRNMIDETLQIQAARREQQEIRAEAIDRAVAAVAENVKRSPGELAAYLAANGSSIASLRRQIEGEIAWRKLQSLKIESGVSVGDDEVKSVLKKLEASKGSEEYRVAEIFLTANAANRAEVQAKAQQMIEALKQGASFSAIARQYSEASTAAVGGDLGWVRPELLPDVLAGAVRQMAPGAVSNPIDLDNGVSIIAVQDVRRILVDDPRDALLNLKQVTIKFPAGTTPASANATIEKFAAAAQASGGCGGAEKLAADFNGEVVQAEAVKMRELPTALQEMMLPMQIGQATAPFGDIAEGVRSIIICGRDQAASQQPTFDSVYAQLNEERVSARARRYLRDLRRDAVIEFR